MEELGTQITDHWKIMQYDGEYFLDWCSDRQALAINLMCADSFTFKIIKYFTKQYTVEEIVDSLNLSCCGFAEDGSDWSLCKFIVYRDAEPILELNEYSGAYRTSEKDDTRPVDKDSRRIMVRGCDHNRKYCTLTEGAKK